jgi:hypothetical protein
MNNLAEVKMAIEALDLNATILEAGSKNRVTFEMHNREVSRAVILLGSKFVSARVPIWDVEMAAWAIFDSVHPDASYIVVPFRWYEYLTVWSIRFKSF